MNAIYGGRVANTYDARVLREYLHLFFNDAAISTGSVPGLPRAIGRLPGTTNIHEYMQLVSSLPDTDAPATFGLPANIDRSLQAVSSARVIDALRRLEHAASAATRFNREVWRQKLGPLVDMWQKLTQSSREALARHRVEVSSDMPPVDQFLLFEYQFACSVVTSVNAALNAIHSVAFGAGHLTPAIQATAAALLAGEVPASWSDQWDASEKPQEWLRGLIARKVALAKWVPAVQAGRSLEGAINLADLFRPGTFLNALRQQTAREAKLPMDRLELVSSIAPGGSISGAVLAVEVEGLWLQGASFKGELGDVAPDAPDLIPMPTLTLAFVGSDDAGRAKPDRGSSLAVPVYFSPDRQRLLTDLHLPCHGAPAQWIIAGVALFLSDKE